jgi:hypothetical protein
MNISSRARVVEPPAVGFEIHRRELPELSRIVDAALEAARLLLGRDLEPVLHDALDAGAVVHLTRRRRQRWCKTRAPPDSGDGVIPPIEAARYLQIENKIRAVVRFDLADQISLVD